MSIGLTVETKNGQRLIVECDCGQRKVVEGGAYLWLQKLLASKKQASGNLEVPGGR